MFWDLKRPLPISEGTIGGIFSEHCLEHLGFDLAQGVLRDLFRVLMKGRSIRISVPDGGLHMQRYIGREEMPFAEHQKAVDPQWTPMQSVNMVYYGHGHKFIYDFETLSLCLNRAGFSNVRRAEFGMGRDQKLLIDQLSRAIESLYVEASKE